MTQTAFFDGPAMIAALDAQRVDRGLDWNGLAVELHAQSSDLNAVLAGNDMCPGALQRTAKRGTMSCQYALTLLRWIGRPPEDFVGNRVNVGDTHLPDAGPDKRLRFDLPSLYAALSAYRQEHGLTWAALAAELDCTPSRLTNLKTARQADMDLTVRVVQHIGRPAAEFVRPTDW